MNRYLATLRLWTIKSPMKRTDYMRKKDIFHHMGKRVMIMSRHIPLYPRLIGFGSNVWVASNVQFVTHDVCHFMLNGYTGKKEFNEYLGCINIGDNVFIGSETQVLYNVNIGNNVVVAAGSLVNKDVPDNSVVGGIPARVLGSFDDFVDKRKEFTTGLDHPTEGPAVTRECEEVLWWRFFAHRENKQQGIG